MDRYKSLSRLQGLIPLENMSEAYGKGLKKYGAQGVISE